MRCKRIFIIGVLVAVLGVVIYLARDYPDRIRFNYMTEANMKRLGVLLHAYHEVKGHFPPPYLVDSNGQKLHSWRTLLLEIENPSLFFQLRLSEPWNSPHNLQFETEIPQFFIPPNEDALTRDKKCITNYFVFIDTNSAFPGTKMVKYKDIDDPSSKVLVIEAPGHYVHWMEPIDFDKVTFSKYWEDTGKKLVNTGMFPYRPGLCMADGSVKYNKGYSVEVFFNMFTCNNLPDLAGLRVPGFNLLLARKTEIVECQ